jgi:hypothetical protein
VEQKKLFLYNEEILSNIIKNKMEFKNNATFGLEQYFPDVISNVIFGYSGNENYEKLLIEWNYFKKEYIDEDDSGEEILDIVDELQGVKERSRNLTYKIYGFFNNNFYKHLINNQNILRRFNNHIYDAQNESEWDNIHYLRIDENWDYDHFLYIENFRENVVDTSTFIELRDIRKLIYRVAGRFDMDLFKHMKKIYYTLNNEITYYDIRRNHRWGNEYIDNIVEYPDSDIDWDSDSDDSDSD